MSHRWPRLFSRLIGFAILVVLSSDAGADDFTFFERKVRPLLSEHCYSCHSAQAKTLHGGLRLDSAAGLNAGGDSGPAVVSGNPGASLLVSVVQYDGEIQMPPKGKLSAQEIEIFVKWVEQGAVFPHLSGDTPQLDGAIDFDTGRDFWSFRKLDVKAVPDVNRAAWPKGRIDCFVLAAMERHGLAPSPRADHATLIRRLCFDLTGLPPTPQQVRDFVNDKDPGAYRRLVDELLETPQYGEKWARWWLDMARYTDRTATWLFQSGQPHLYRDWVVDAFFEDMPYDEFTRRQLATDLMHQTGPEDFAALGFLSLSPTYWKELKLPCEIINVIVADEWEERVDAVSRTFLGLTVACARCHDHKFDPISSEDYYALAGVFASCRQVERPLISEEAYEPVRMAKEKVAQLEDELAKLRKQKPSPDMRLDEIASQIASIKTSTPLYDTPMATALAEESLFVERAGESADQGTRLDYRPGPRDLPAFIRGNPNRPGPVIPRRFLTVLSQDPQPYEHGSGRLELAESITTEAAPLAARVIVNRIWCEHFGQGIVDTPSNFGAQGNRPTHPGLLDDLAARFIAGSWSLKRLHREILLSATWQQSSAPNSNSDRADPDNRWLSRMNRRRLTIEQWRDAMLAVSGTLDYQQGGPSQAIDTAENRRRTIYATVHRRDMSPTLMVHDFPDPTQHSPRRSATVSPLQGLYTLNGPLLSNQSRQLADRLRNEADENHQRIVFAYQLLFSRLPTPREVELGLSYLDRSPEDERQRWQQYAHVLLASNEFIFLD